MKLTTFILITTLVQVSAKGFGQKISISETNTPLVKVLEQIRQQSGYEFFYDVKDLSGQKISIKLKNASVEDALKVAVKDLPLSYKILKNQIVLTRNEPTLVDAIKIFFADPINVRGKITDTLGTPLEGATIYVISKLLSEDGKSGGGSNRRTVTGKDGTFNVSGNEGDHIIISYIGYAGQAIVIKEGMPFQNVLLRKVSKELNEVMVQTGYQTLSKESATGSFGKPDMKVFSRRTGTLDVVGRLEGQVAGLQITNLRNGPGNFDVSGNGSATSTHKSQVRGTSSVQNGTPPLYVVNGVIVNDFSSINVNDIEDISVLKDAQASAIWGARSASGVIVIKTKSGQNNERVSINYSGFLNFSSKPDFGYAKMLNSRQYIDVAKEIFDPVAYSWDSGLSFIAPHDQILYDQYRNIITSAVATRRLDSLAAIDNTSQIKALNKPAFSTNHSVSASGGTNAYSFYASLGYSGARSGQPGEKSDTYNISFNQTINAGSRIKFSLNTSLVNEISSSQNPISPTRSFLPYQLFRDAAGNSLNMNYMNGYIDSLTQDYQARSRINLDYNPINEVGLTRTNRNNLGINITANASVDIWKGLKFSGTYGYVKSPGSNEFVVDHKAISERIQAVGLTVAPTVDDIPVYYYPITGSAFTRAEYDQRNWTVRNQLMYDGSIFKGRDKISIQVGQEVQQSDSYNNSTFLLGYDDALGTYASLDNKTLLGGIFPTVSGYGFYNYLPYNTTKEINRFISYFALGSYSFDQKYTLSTSVRQDYSNQFANEIATQNKPIWSIGGRWQISKERFMQSVNWVNSLGLRLTYGITGNSPYVGRASQYDIIDPVTTSNNYYYNMIAGDAFTVSSVGNKTLAWENTSNVNLGIDYSILKGRISGGFDLYSRVTTDMIGNVKLNSLTGYNSLVGNIGKMINKGIEVSLRSQNITGKDFNWTSSFNIGYNHNKLVSYATPSPAGNTVSARMIGIPVIGYSMSPLWAYRYAGLDNTGDPQIYLHDGTITKKPNVAKVEDLKYMGTTIPVYSGGFSNSFSYKSFSASINMIYNFGGVMRKDVNTFYTGRLANSPSFVSGNISTYFLDRWKNPGDEAFTNIPAYKSSAVASGNRNTSYYTLADINVVSASYITIRDFTLSYDLNPNLLRALKIQRANIFMQANNFLVWVANDQGINPELAGPGTGAAPVRHTYSLGVNLSF